MGWQKVVRKLFRGPSDEEIADELDFHLEMRSADHRDRGLGAEQAENAAQRQFGGRARMAERVRGEHVSGWMDSAGQDLGYAVRGLRGSRSFTATAIGAITLAIGSATAVFTVVDHSLLRSLPYRDAERLVWTGIRDFGMRDSIIFPASEYRLWREQEKVFERFTVFEHAGDCVMTAIGGGPAMDPVRVRCAAVSHDFLATLGAPITVGRDFLDAEDRANGSAAVLISDAFRRRHFVSPAAAVGAVITIHGDVRTIVGVLPRDFEYPSLAAADVIYPLGIDFAKQDMARGPVRILNAIGRLRPGVTVAQAETALAAPLEHLMKALPPSFRSRVGLAVVPVRDWQTSDVRRTLSMLSAAVLFVLLIATANVANLLLARAAAREQEILVRLSLGAGKVRLLRQWLTESALLGVLGAASGLLLGHVLLRALAATAPAGVPRLEKLTLDARIAVFAVGLGLVCSLLFGLAPARYLRRLTLSGAGRGSAGYGRRWPAAGLIAVQVAASLVLVTGAGLMLVSLRNLQATALGVRTGGVLTVDLPRGVDAGAEPAIRNQRFQELLERLSGVPGITAAVADSLPPGEEFSRGAITVEGRPAPDPGDPSAGADFHAVSAGYLDVLGVPLRMGRFFDESGGAGGEEVAVVNETFARRFFPDESPVGRRVRGGNGAWIRIAGVYADTRNNGFVKAARPEVLRPYWQSSVTRERLLLAVRPAITEETARSLMRDEIRRLFPAHPVEIASYRQRLSVHYQRPRFQSLLLALFGMIALTLAAVGIYGTVGYIVARRTSEIGIRMALGAAPAAIRNHFLGYAGVALVAGLGAGVPAALLASGAASALLFGVEPHDGWVLGVSVGVIAVTVLVAAAVPAGRAASVDPVVALRGE